MLGSDTAVAGGVVAAGRRSRRRRGRFGRQLASRVGSAANWPRLCSYSSTSRASSDFVWRPAPGRAENRVERNHPDSPRRRPSSAGPGAWAAST